MVTSQSTPSFPLFSIELIENDNISTTALQFDVEYSTFSEQHLSCIGVSICERIPEWGGRLQTIMIRESRHMKRELYGSLSTK